MSLGGFIRRFTYWTNDFLHKSPVGKQYSNIGKILSNKNNIGVEIQKGHLNKLLEHAVKHTAFYSTFEANDISTFPVINKLIIRENYDNFKVPVSAIPGQVGPVHVQRTSGSTGTPLAVPQDTIKRNRRIAELKYFGKIAGYHSHEKLAHLRIWTKWQNKTKLQTFKENIYAVDCSKIDDQTLADLCQLIKKKRILAIWGYASWYDMLLEYIERKSIKLPSIKVIIAGSEMLQASTKIGLMEKLACNVVSRYSNEEQGILGQDRGNDENYYLNHASYFFEFLKLDRDEKAEPGEICRIVVTDLFNYAFPLIRYDTGDTGIFAPNTPSSNHFPVLCKIYGRLLDLIYDTQGTPVHPMSLARILKNYDQVKLWQFIQKKQSEYELKLKIDGELNVGDCMNQIKIILGNDSIIELSIVDDIPVLSSGKRKPVICELKR